MRIVTIVSPDKITHSMFTDFYRAKNTASEVISLDISSLFSIPIQESIVADTIKYMEENGKLDTTDIIIKYKIKTRVNVVLTDKLAEYSDYILKFDIFSMHPEVVKAKDENFIKVLIDSWVENIERLNK